MPRKPLRTLEDCKREVERMMRLAQTKLIMPVLLLGIVRLRLRAPRDTFSDSELRAAYEDAVRFLASRMGHNVHIGAKYEDAYGMRMSRYGALETIGHLRYKLAAAFSRHASELASWLPGRIEEHSQAKLGIIPSLRLPSERLRLSADPEAFAALISREMNRNPTGFEIVSFAIIKIHLDRFACRVYRDTRASATDHGADLATNFGVVYQVKKLRLMRKSEGRKLYSKLKHDFDRERLTDGQVIVVIDDIAEEVRQYLIDMKVQSLDRSFISRLAASFVDPEDRQKVLRVIYEEFCRDYSGVI